MLPEMENDVMQKGNWKDRVRRIWSVPAGMWKKERRWKVRKVWKWAGGVCLFFLLFPVFYIMGFFIPARTLCHLLFASGDLGTRKTTDKQSFIINLSHGG